MVSIKWCLNEKNGIEIVEPNKNMSESYISMAEESIDVLDKIEKSKIWIATTSYYIFYYSLYSFMIRLGIKSEIHSCSIEFMKEFLGNYYNSNDISLFEKAFGARKDLQYYSNRPVDESIIIESKKSCKDFYVKTCGILSILNQTDINRIRKNIFFINN